MVNMTQMRLIPTVAGHFATHVGQGVDACPTRIVLVTLVFQPFTKSMDRVVGVGMMRLVVAR